MNNEEQVFDFLAAAEDTGKQLDALIKAIPGEVRNTLAAEYRQSPWLATLPTTADRVTAAAEVYHRGACAKLVLCGGKLPGHRLAEADVMARMMTALSVWDEACDNVPPEWWWENDEQDLPTRFDPVAARSLAARCATPDFWRTL